MGDVLKNLSITVRGIAHKIKPIPHRPVNGYEPPAWHAKELARREKLYTEGKLPVYDWADIRVVWLDKG